MITIEAYHKEFIGQSLLKLRDFENKISKCLALLSEEQVWHKENEVSNSIANLILHICGNARQYIISGIGGAIDVRTRDLEFSKQSGRSKAELQSLINTTLSEAEEVLTNVDINTMLDIKDVQIFQYSPITIVIIVTEHFSYHTGQIAAITKSLLNQDLGFYAGLPLK